MFLTLTLVFSVPLATAAQSNSGKKPALQKAPTENRLVLSARTPIKSEFADLLYGPQKCDGSGNLFLQTDITGTEPLKKLNQKGELIAEFRPRSNPNTTLDGANDFAVDANGDVYLLVFPHEIDATCSLSSQMEPTSQPSSSTRDLPGVQVR